jgi:Spy/CpxP family protein refolding chaperone
MKPWIKRTLIGAFGATVLLGGLTACGHQRPGPWSDAQVSEMRGKAIERISSKLELTEAQKAKLGSLADELIAQRAALKGGQTDPRAQLDALIAGPTFDRSGAQALLAQKTQAVQDQGPKVVSAMADFFDSLTPTQQAQVRELLAKRRGHGWWGRG